MSTIELPENEDVKYLAALIYGEASVSASGVSEEMRAIGWAVRNRFHHVNTDYGEKDAKWFGKGMSYRSIIEYYRSIIDKEHKKEDVYEFKAVYGSNYKNFLRGLPDEKNKAQIEFAKRCIDAANEVFRGAKPDTPGRTGEYPYVWFQRGKTSPNQKRAVAEPTRVGAHYFWSFAEGKEKG